ncbi:sensor histidine kinase [Flexithrix dorotheae]|uniref:sensor histidine kinase n=1 Tax=Flexithrix dorotheae TaxID=70993 RepID=UPI00039E3E7B|nr:HAMP domain-containing sensor histidine kinase [Flexithrix dorotheae]
MKLLGKIVNSGVYENTPSRKRKTIRIGNQMAIFLSFTFFCHFFLFSWYELTIPKWIVLWSALFQWTIPFLQSKGKYILARLSTLILDCTVIFICSLLVGKASHIYFYYFVAICVPLMLFSKKEKINTLLSYLLIGTIIILDVFLGFNPFVEFNPPLEVQQAISLFVYPIGLTLIFMFVFYLTNESYLATKKFQSELGNSNHLNEELQNVNKALDQFVYSASHDLRAPIASVLGLIELAKSEDSIEKVKEYLLLQEKSLLKLDEFIRDILNYSRNARMEIQREEVDFNEMIHEIFSQHQFNKVPFEIEKMKSVSQNNPFITDRKRLEVVLNNLISNAVRYSNPYIESPYIRVNVKVNPSQAIIKVEDNGLGIDNHHLTKIFDMFYRATDRIEGTGIGLYIVKETIEKIRGEVLVESELEKGSCFTVIIPNLKDI